MNKGKREKKRNCSIEFKLNCINAAKNSSQNIGAYLSRERNNVRFLRKGGVLFGMTEGAESTVYLF